jgi:hypothetical protein
VEPVYRHIEFCRDVETLWGKMREGRWDWLGVHPKGQFVLGSPRRGGLGGHVSGRRLRPGAVQGEHGVRVFGTPGKSGSEDWLPTEAEAKREFAADIARLRAQNGPVLARVQRIEGGEVVEDEFIVTRPPTYR